MRRKGGKRAMASDYFVSGNGEIKFADLTVYLTTRIPPQEISFVLSENLQGFGIYCENPACQGSCREADCSRKVEAEIAELVYEREILKVLKFSYDRAGKLWVWFSPALRKSITAEKKLYLEILPKENIKGYVVVAQLEISETKEILAGYNITDLLNNRNHWNIIEIPLGVGGFDLSWRKLSHPGTLTLVLKAIPLDSNPIKGSLYLKKISFL
jgi:hypothetical protein